MTESKPTYATRRELYSIVAVIYIMIAFVVAATGRLDDRSILSVISYFLLFVAALGSSITFSILKIWKSIL